MKALPYLIYLNLKFNLYFRLYGVLGFWGFGVLVLGFSCGV